VTIEEVGDGALGQGDPAADQLAVDLGDAAVLGMAEVAHQGQDIEPELMIGQGEGGLGLGPVGAAEAGALGVGTASDQEGHPDGALEGGDGAEVVIVSRGPGLAFGAIAEDRSQIQGVVRLRPWSSWSSWLGHPKAPGSDFHLLSTSADPVTFATVVYFDRSE